MAIYILLSGSFFHFLNRAKKTGHIMENCEKNYFFMFNSHRIELEKELLRRFPIRNLPLSELLILTETLNIQSLISSV